MCATGSHAIRIGLVVSASILSGTAGCSSNPPGKSAQGCDDCARARLENKWCDACKIGYVAGVPIKSRLLFECLDAHGHTLVLETFTCPTCKEAILQDGFCERCRIGFLDKQAYFSRLTYELAHGTPQEVEKIACPACRRNAKRYGWCEKCNAGMVGNVLLGNLANYEPATRGFELMLTANSAADRCEMCALAIVTDTRCFVCKINYKEGKPLAATSQP